VTHFLVVHVLKSCTSILRSRECTSFAFASADEENTLDVNVVACFCEIDRFRFTSLRTYCHQLCGLLSVGARSRSMRLTLAINDTLTILIKIQQGNLRLVLHDFWLPRAKDRQCDLSQHASCARKISRFSTIERSGEITGARRPVICRAGGGRMV